MKMKKKTTAYFYLLITFFAWGSLYVVSKFVLGKVPPFTVSFIRYLIAGTALFFILKKRKHGKIEKQDYKYIFLIGFVGYTLATSAQLLGTKYSNASLASLINSMNPISIMILAAIILKEKLTVKKVVCIIMSIIGVYTIIGSVNGNVQVLGILISVFAVLTWSVMSVYVRKVTQKYDAIQITTYGIIVAAFCTLPLSAIELANTYVQFDWSIILWLLYMGLVCTALAHVLWNKSLSILEAGTCSSFYPLQPMVAVFLGWIFLGEKMNVNFIIGAVLIIAGVLFSLIEPKAQKSAEELL